MVKARLIMPELSEYHLNSEWYAKKMVGQEIWLGPLAVPNWNLCDSDVYWDVVGPPALLEIMADRAVVVGLPRQIKFTVCRHMLDVGD